MRLQDIFRMFSDYLRLGICLIVFSAIVLLVGYGLIYKILCKGKRKVDVKNIFWHILLGFYLVIVLSITLLGRSSLWNGQIVSFFYSYKEAWISGSATAWRNIILNIFMFVPLGFWLPIGKEKFRVFWRTYLIGFLVSLGIEGFQLIFSLGVCEVADLFNNTLGTLIGYGLYKMFSYVVLLFKKEKPRLAPVLFCQVPLILSVLMFAGLYIAYQKQELGNLSIEYIAPYSKDAFVIESKGKYSTDSKNVMVYQTKIWTVEETEAFAKQFFENLGTQLDESRNDIYEETAVYWAEDDFSLWIDYNGGTYHVTDFETSFPSEGKEQPLAVTDATEEMIVEALGEYGIKIPENSIFYYSLDAGYVFEAEQIEMDGVVYDGILICDYYDNGKFATIRNNISTLEAYKEFEIYSEQEAYEQILDGKFVSALDMGSRIELGQVSLDYMLDTKGFFQPIYVFELFEKEEYQWIQIPAIK